MFNLCDFIHWGLELPFIICTNGLAIALVIHCFKEAWRY